MHGGVKSSAAIKSILVVEDDPTYLHLWQRLIKDAGVQKAWAVDSPEKAQKILQEKKVDLLMSDVMLPGTNGYELAKFAKKKNPLIQILLTTGYGTDLSRFNLGELKCHLLHKPYHNLNDVCRLLKHLVKGEDVFQDMDEDSFSENEDQPTITEWTL